VEYRSEAACIVDDGFDLAAMAHDAIVLEQALPWSRRVKRAIRSKSKSRNVARKLSRLQE
jgi:hypothetical protein